MDDFNRLTQIGVPLKEKWVIFAGIQPHIQLTGYYQTLIRGMQCVTGFTDTKITENNWQSLSQAYINVLQPGFYRQALETQGRIRGFIVDMFATSRYKKEMGIYTQIPQFKEKLGLTNVFPVLRMNDISIATAYYPIAFLKAQSIGSLSVFEDHIQNKICHALELGIVGIKYPLAYVRSLKSQDRVTKKQAEAVFKDITCASTQEITTLQDYLLHFTLRWADQFHLPVTFHTGILAGPWGPASRLEDAHPLHLTNLFSIYPNIKFVLMHGGYPYTRQAAILAKSFFNVYLESSWLPMISPCETEAVFDQWL